MNKVCFKCNIEQPMSNFYKHKGMADGHLGKCKNCTKQDVKQNYRDNHLAKLQYDKMRNQRPERKKAMVQYSKRKRANNPIKARAWRMVGKAVMSGKLVRSSCQHCGSNDRVQAHHEDYNKPLDIIWLCFQCHRGDVHNSLI